MNNRRFLALAAATALVMCGAPSSWSKPHHPKKAQTTSTAAAPAASASTAAAPDAASQDEKPKVEVKDSVMSITVGKDGVTVKAADLLKELKAISLDDTIAGGADDAEAFPGVSDNTRQVVSDTMERVSEMVNGFFISLVCLVALALLFFYLHRSRKYKTIDRAIAAGYPLPDEFFGKYHRPMPQQPQQPPYVASPQPSDGQPGAAAQPGAQPWQAQQPVQPATPYLGGWNVYRSAFRTTVIGLAGIVFFAVVNAMPLVIIFCIIAVMGLGKMFFVYNEQRVSQTIHQPQYQPPQYQQPQPHQQQYQQPQQPQQPPVFSQNDPWGTPQQ